MLRALSAFLSSLALSCYAHCQLFLVTSTSHVTLTVCFSPHLRISSYAQAIRFSVLCSANCPHCQLFLLTSTSHVKRTVSFFLLTCSPKKMCTFIFSRLTHGPPVIHNSANIFCHNRTSRPIHCQLFYPHVGTLQSVSEG